nr:integrin beta 1A [Halisarca dujardinii]
MVKILLLFLGAATLSFAVNPSCESQQRCDDCVRIPGCGWCNDENYRLLHSNSTTGATALFCRSNETLVALGCPADKIYQPQSEVTATSTPPMGRVSPQNIHVDLRIGQPHSQQVTITPANSFPIDMYVLMDLSLTMNDDLGTLRSISQKLIDTLKNLTSDYRLGFGSFVDKTLYPFSDQINRDYPCGIGPAPGGDFVPPENCDPAYDFKHRLSLTDDTVAFQAAINSSKISASFDHPEGLFDALMQVAVCTNVIGWRSEFNTRRLILAITDDEYHYALDGRLSGIIQPNDGQCHLDGNEYSEEQNLDYPSSSQLGKVFQANSVIPIFAVTADQKSLYDDLVEVLKGAFVGEIDGRLENLQMVIQDRYQELSGTVIPFPGSVRGVDVSFTPDCGTGDLRSNSTDSCTGITATNPAIYTFVMEAQPEVCSIYPQGHAIYETKFVGFGPVTFNISFHCSCEDVCGSVIENSADCSGSGNLDCGACLCHGGFYGSQCECSGTRPNPSNQLICQDQSSKSICSGRGECKCGYCECDKIDNTTDSYQGEHCQCDQEACPKNSQGVVCNGHGNCSACSSLCVCDEGYTNHACECTTSNATCISPEDTQDRVCSSHGICECGLCLCDYRSNRTGSYCDICPECVLSCGNIGDCIVCKVQGRSDCQAQCGEGANITIFSNRSFVESNQEYPTKLLRRCQVDYETCQLRFYLDSLIQGTEADTIVAVYVDTTSSAYLNIRSDACGVQEEVWPIVVGIVLGIIVLGLLALIIWRAAVYWMDYMEYRRFVVEQEKNVVWSKSDNPVYVAPTKDYVNPQYRKKELEAFQGTAL